MDVADAPPVGDTVLPVGWSGQLARGSDTGKTGRLRER